MNQEEPDTIDGFFAVAGRQEFYEGAERGQLLDVLPLLHHENKNCILIEGPEGYGKTALAHQIYLSSKESDRLTGFLHGKELTQETSREVFVALLSAFRFKEPVHGEIENEAAFLELLAARSDNYPSTLVIDDAHFISYVALSVLTRLMEVAEVHQCQLILLYEPDAEVLMADSAWKSYVSKYGHPVLLRSFTQKETDEYVRFLLVQSERQTVRFSKQDISRIYQQSKGTPVLINEAVAMALQHYDQQPEDSRGGFVPKWHLVSLTIVAVAVIALIVFGSPDDRIQPRFSETIKPQISDPFVQEEQGHSPSGVTDLAQGYDQDPDAFSPIRFTDLSKPVGVQPQPLEEVPVESPAVVQKPEVTSSRELPIQEPQSESKVVEATPPQVTPPKQTMAEKLAKLRSVNSTKPLAQVSPGESLSADWLKNMSPNRYTLQLVGGANEEAIKSFVREHGSYRKLGYFETDRQGEPWYVVVYGDFPNRETATDAVANLPNKLRSSKPWPRTASDIQSKMR